MRPDPNGVECSAGRWIDRPDRAGVTISDPNTPIVRHGHADRSSANLDAGLQSHGPDVNHRECAIACARNIDSLGAPGLAERHGQSVWPRADLDGSAERLGDWIERAEAIVSLAHDDERSA